MVDRADAFVGEGLVISGKNLTGPAKTIITNPTFLPGSVTAAETAATGSVVEAGAVAGTFQTAGLLPALGASVLAFGVGAGIGTEICGVLGIEGCWDFTSDAADPAETGGHWVYRTIKSPPFPAFTWYWAEAGNSSAKPTPDGQKGCPARPPGTSYVIDAIELSTVCGSPPVSTGKFLWKYALRSSMENRTLTYSPTDNPSVGNTAHTAPGNWDEKLAAAIAGHEGDAEARLGQHIASKVPGSGIKSPYSNYVNIPNCDGLIYASCADLLEDLGLEPHREDLNWSDVETTTPNEVRELEPAKSKEVEVGTGVQVITNPPEEGMPIFIPTPNPGETYDEYVARLNPSLDPQKKVVSEANADPHSGVNVVLSVDPKGGTRIPPSGSPVDVYVNPPYLGGAGGGGGDCDTSIGAVNFGPLNQDLGHQFPFGIFVFLGEMFSEWSDDAGGPPNWEIPIVPEGTFGSDGVVLKPNFHILDPYIEPFRIVMLFSTFVGVLYFLSTAVLKLQGDNS